MKVLSAKAAVTRTFLRPVPQVTLCSQAGGFREEGTPRSYKVCRSWGRPLFTFDRVKSVMAPTSEFYFHSFEKRKMLSADIPLRPERILEEARGDGVSD